MYRPEDCEEVRSGVHNDQPVYTVSKHPFPRLSRYGRSTNSRLMLGNVVEDGPILNQY